MYIDRPSSFRSTSWLEIRAIFENTADTLGTCSKVNRKSEPRHRFTHGASYQIHVPRSDNIGIALTSIRMYIYVYLRAPCAAQNNFLGAPRQYKFSPLMHYSSGRLSNVPFVQRDGMFEFRGLSRQSRKRFTGKPHFYNNVVALHRIVRKPGVIFITDCAGRDIQPEGSR